MGSNVNNKGCTLPMYLECAYNWYLLILENRLYEIFLQNYKSNHSIVLERIMHVVIITSKPYFLMGTNWNLWKIIS